MIVQKERFEKVRVGEEAESAQQERHEEVYREEAIKKQIEFLQKQLDEMNTECFMTIWIL